jgi:geranylgeranyl diphosphate synthase type II
MDAKTRIEQTLSEAVAGATAAPCPPLLASAVRYAVFPGGARIRPKLCLAVAGANGDTEPVLADAAAAAIELLHCASLVHDDLPCFDDAAERRGKPSVHVAYGERLAVLAGDALIVLAFETLGRAASVSGQPERLAALLSSVGRGVGMPLGIAAGQAWESEPAVPVSTYHQAKTGSLFVAATRAGAAAAGLDPEPWRLLGQRIGEAYQVADDIRDAAGSAAELGKPVGQDEAFGRPSAVRELGLDGAVRRLEALVAEGTESIPECPGQEMLRRLIAAEALQFLPEKLRRAA